MNNNFTILLPSLKIILLFLIYLLPTAALAAPETRFNSVFYMVEGNTAEDIWADILTKSPVKHNGRSHVAYTKWHVDWKFWWLDNGESCDISKVTTRLDVTYTLPRLKQTSATPASVIAHWESYNAALFEHELGHKELGIKAAIEIENKISNMARGSSCKQLEIDANKIGKSVIEKYSQLEKEYDKLTIHGLTTGAVFP